VNDDCLKLTTYFGERDRVGGRFLADALTGVYARNKLQTSLIIRGAAGFGERHRLRSDRQLTLSEDLPLVSVAVDTRERIEAVAREVTEFEFDGLVTFERARMLTGRIGALELPPEEVKLTVYVGRQARAAGRPAHEAIVDLLHGRGVAGATVLLGVDGTAHGARQRARFFGRNAEVPLMVISVGDGEAISALLPELGALLKRPLVTLERVRVLKRDGRRLAALPEPSPDRRVWQKLMVYAGEDSEYDGRPLYLQLLTALRGAGAAGATSIRGIWGYHGDHVPHGDSLWQLRRRVPVLTAIVDVPERVQEWFAVVDEITAETGLVTSELVPVVQDSAHRAERR
jgi:PII-like signaling protein